MRETVQRALNVWRTDCHRISSSPIPWLALRAGPVACVRQRTPLRPVGLHSAIHLFCRVTYDIVDGIARALLTDSHATLIELDGDYRYFRLVRSSRRVLIINRESGLGIFRSIKMRHHNPTSLTTSTVTVTISTRVVAPEKVALLEIFRLSHKSRP